MPEANKALAPLIAVIGCDGSGKSTLSAEILEWIRHYGPAEAAHLGKQSGNVGRALGRLPLLGGLIDRKIARKSDKVRTQRDSKAPGLLTSLLIFAFSLRRLFRFRRMIASRRKGLIIVTDRYPQLDLPGAYDGTGLASTSPGSPAVRWLARRERKLFVWMTSFRPDLIIRLNIDLETASARKPDHRKQRLREKIALTPLLTFAGAPIVDIDAALPLPEVLAAAKIAIAPALAARGYSVRNVAG